MSSNRVHTLSIIWIICILSSCIMAESESCCSTNSTLCEPYTVPSKSRCNYVRCCCEDYASEEALANYINFQYCATWATSIGFPKEATNAILLIIMNIYFVLVLGNVADKYFAPIMAETADTLGVSHNIAGVTFLAFANGAPDISSGVAAIQHGGEQTKLGLGALLGVAVFNPIMISAVISTFAVSAPVKVVRFPYVRDCIFLFLAASVVLKISLAGKIVLFEAVGMICLYVLYVSTAVISEIYQKRKGKHLVAPVCEHGHSPKYQSLDENTQPLKIIDAEAEPYHPSAKHVDSDVAEQYHPSAKHLWMSIKSEIQEEQDAAAQEADNVAKDRHWCRKLGILILYILQGPTIVTNKLCEWTIPLTDEEHWNDRSAVITCTTAPMMIFFVFELFDVHLGILPLWVLALLFGVTMSGITYYLCKQKYKAIQNEATQGGLVELVKPKLSLSMKDMTEMEQKLQSMEKLKSRAVMQYFFLLLGFLSAVAWINLAAVEVVNILSTLGVVSSIDLAILGMTVLAWGNSTPDLVADVGVSRRGYAKMGIAAAIGGPTLDVLIGVGMGTTLVCIEHGEAIIPISVNIFFGCLGVMIGISSYLTCVGCNGWTLNKYIGYFLFLYYVTFLTVNIVSYQFDVQVV